MILLQLDTREPGLAAYWLLSSSKNLSLLRRRLSHTYAIPLRFFVPVTLKHLLTALALTVVVEIPIPQPLADALRAYRMKADKTYNLLFPTAGCKPKLDFLDFSRVSPPIDYNVAPVGRGRHRGTRFYSDDLTGCVEILPALVEAHRPKAPDCSKGSASSTITPGEVGFVNLVKATALRVPGSPH